MLNVYMGVAMQGYTSVQRINVRVNAKALQFGP